MAPLPTTTIGSLSRFDPDLHKSIERALAFQREHRLDILTDGEQRTDMISYFAESFEGLAIEGGSPLVTGKISLKNGSEAFSKVADLVFIRSMYPDLTVKVALTGPTTLGMTCASKKIKSHYKNILDFDLYEDIAVAGGMFFSTVLTFLVVPATYVAMERLRVRVVGSEHRTQPAGATPAAGG